jgi:hypothetical protein
MNPMALCFYGQILIMLDGANEYICYVQKKQQIKKELALCKIRMHNKKHITWKNVINVEKTR